ncbi:MAG: PilZ domain-containing protein, partial [Terriglobales bacterium]
LRVVLVKRGPGVEIADSGAQALSKLEEQRVDFVLIDFHKPQSEGMKIVNAFSGRQTDDENRPSLLGLAPDANAASHAEGRGFFDLVITKPVDVVLLCEVIERFAATPVLSSEVPPPSHERRSSKRVRIGGAKLTLSDGTKQACRVIDLSLGGAAVETHPKPAIGAQVTIGRTDGRVTRHTASGVAVKFTRPNSI